MHGYYLRIAKSKYYVYEFGRGKNQTSKNRHRRAIKRRAKQRLNRYLNDL